MLRENKLVVGLLGLLVATYVDLHFHAMPTAKRALPADITDAPVLSLQRIVESALPSLAPSLMVAVACMLGLAILESRSGSIREFLKSLRHSRRRALSTAVVTSAVLSLVVLGPGQMVRGDTVTHLLRAQFFLQTLQVGELPMWAPQWHGGYPFAQFYSPLENVVFSIFGAIVGDMNTGAKIALYLAHLTGAIGVFLLVFRVTSNGIAAWFASLCFTVVRSHLATVLFHGNFPGALFLALVPYLFLAAHDLVRGPRPRRTLSLALLLAAATLCHVAYLRPLTPAWALFLSYLVLSERGSWRERWPTLRSLTVAHLLALNLSLFLVVPMVAERNLVHFPPAYRFYPPPPLGSFVHLFVWAPFQPAYQGIGLMLPALLAVGGLRRLRPNLATCLVGAARIALVLWGPDMRVHYLNGFLLAVAAGLGIHRSSQRAPRAGLTIVLVLTLVVLMEHAPFLAMNTYAVDHDAGGKAETEVLESIRSGPNPHGRMITAIQSRESLHFDLWWQYRSVSTRTLGGPLGQGVPRSFDPSGSMLDYVESTLNATGRLDSTAARCLSLMNVSAVLLRDGADRFVQDPREDDFWTKSSRNEALLVRSSSPVAFFDTIRRMSDIELAPLAVVRASGFDLTRSHGRAMFLEDDEYDRFSSTLASPVGGEEPRTTSPFSLLSVERSQQGFGCEVRTPGAGFLRLNQNFYPHQEIRVDGERVAVGADALGGILVPLHGGVHRVEWSPRLSPLRKWTAAWSAAVFLLVLAWIRRPVSIL